MRMHSFSILLKAIAYTVFMWALLSCKSSSDNKKEGKGDSSSISSTSDIKESIPDSIVDFLITSAVTDFHKHQPPTAIDFRNVKVGYSLSSNKEKIYVLCGEFLSKEAKETWLQFATVKTSGYEQYLGNQAQAFCEKATIISTGEVDLALHLKNKLVGVGE